ncbi:MAG: hypothetical protein JWM78_1575 [Verrucomicrobiaceae bacterium]|nr:hypothetical protein [Verrucomicrobiaceae bacterium]
MRWFKYMERQFAEQLANYGNLRIRRLSYYEDIESHGAAIGDPEENKITLYSHAHAKTGAELNDFEREGFVTFANEEEAQRAMFFNVQFERKFVGRPSYAFCATQVQSEDIRQKFNDENKLSRKPEYDACVEIVDHISFVNALKKHMNEASLKYYGHGNCFYREKKVRWNQWNPNVDQCPAFLKALKYKWQGEVRILFESIEVDPNEFIDLNAPELIPLCRLHLY